MLRTVPGLLLLTALLASGHAQPPVTCVVCNTLIRGSFFWVTTSTLPERQAVCSSCHEIESRCALCKLPVKDHGRRIDDGRLLCARDFRAGIFDAHEARRVYEETKREVHGILGGFGTLPDRNITVSLVDARELRRLSQTLPTAHDDMTLMGLTRTEVLGAAQFRHDIHLLSGLGSARLAAVAAHEYTHAWLHENVPSRRKLERDTVEGFCDLIAYKVMTGRRAEHEKKIILANAYTRGQINAFVEAESAHQFHRIVLWIKTGVDESLSPTNSAHALALRDPSPAPFSWPPPAPVRTAVPDTLRLKGISRGATRRFALINDTTLAEGEEARVRVGTTNVVMRLHRIKERSVVIQVRGAVQSVELFLLAN